MAFWALRGAAGQGHWRHVGFLERRVVLVAGLWLAIGHITTAAAQAVTIVGIPVALANLKMIPVTCFPFGRKIVDSDHIPFGWEPMVKL